jgi:hypothetical protein
VGVIIPCALGRQSKGSQASGQWKAEVRVRAHVHPDTRTYVACPPPTHPTYRLSSRACALAPGKNEMGHWVKVLLGVLATGRDGTGRVGGNGRAAGGEWEGRQAGRQLELASTGSAAARHSGPISHRLAADPDGIQRYPVYGRASGSPSDYGHGAALRLGDVAQPRRSLVLRSPLSRATHERPRSGYAAGDESLKPKTRAVSCTDCQATRSTAVLSCPALTCPPAHRGQGEAVSLVYACARARGQERVRELDILAIADYGTDSRRAAV